MRRFSNSAQTYIGLIGFLVLVKLLFVAFPTAFPLAEQESAFAWTTIGIIALMGFAGVILSPRTGFPEMWDESVSNRQRFLIPFLIGLAYGGITVINDLAHPSPVHLKLPLSIAFYTYGAVFLEIMLRLFAVTVIVWLLSNLLLRGRWQKPIFWIAAIISALYEPLPHIREQLYAAPPIAAPAIILDWITEPLFVANVVAAWLFRKYGFLAPLTMRLSFYLVWHIIYGGLFSAASR